MAIYFILYHFSTYCFNERDILVFDNDMFCVDFIALFISLIISHKINIVSVQETSNSQLRELLLGGRGGHI